MPYPSHSPFVKTKVLDEITIKYCGTILSNNKTINPLSANPTKCSNTLKQFVGKLPTNCLSVFDHFVRLALKGLILLDEWKLKVVLSTKKILIRKKVTFFLSFAEMFP